MNPMPPKSSSVNWHTIGQWALLAIALTANFFTNDRRITTLEVTVTIQSEMMKVVLENQTSVARSLERLTVLNEKNEERHKEEDRRRK